MVAIIAASVGAVVGAVAGLFGERLLKRIEARRQSILQKRPAIFKALRKDLSSLRQHLKESRETDPTKTSFACLFLSSKTWCPNSKWNELRESAKGVLSSKTRERVDLVDKRYPIYQDSLNAFTSQCVDSLTEIVAADSTINVILLNPSV